jgi:hypothetical protein
MNTEFLCANILESEHSDFERPGMYMEMNCPFHAENILKINPEYFCLLGCDALQSTRSLRHLQGMTVT